MSEFLSYQLHCLSGRATAVVSATGYRKRGPNIQMVCKMYHPEVQRRHEGLTMEVIYDIAKEDQAKANHDQKRSELGLPSMLKHLPSFYFYCDVKGTTTHHIRSMVGHNWDGHRTMRIIGMKQLKKITTVKGWEFIKAWLEGVVCHSFLWQNFVEHGDPSLSNLMYDPVEKCGVLTDFDLSLLQWEPRVFGTDRTGTIPFMALDLLTSQYWTGYRARYYHHELESFLWILPYVFLLYQDGKRKGTAIEDWITSSYDSCFAAKLTFLSKINDAKSKVQSDFKNCWVLASALCRTLRHGYGVILDTRDDFNTRNLDLDNFEQENLNISSTLWENFYKQLEKSLSEDVNAADCTLLLDRIEYFKPNFDLSIDKRRTIYDELYIKYSKILHPT
ncbi:hypothetical protein CPB84DRAFT_254716 [Gymnopilus junonius]|uniref:Fungal-type protein kinase domain-containing protein n=1 Tax=Gymnopilus junonius TaxID=109634 RepID=A0A9P5NEV2_GYMJU|nr:hypothetical protein CPB84DRAFT_254716 [Gymnopilus junonius]